MSKTVISIEHVWKQYRLGTVGTGTLANDLRRILYRIAGKEDPFLKVGETNDRTKKGGSDLVWALQDISFQVKQGETLGIIGRNGAGKSTLLKILSRVTGPTRGELKVRGRIASLLEVGTGFNPDLSGRENIFLNGAILGMKRSEIRAKFDEIVAFSGVERYIDTPVKRYSSGMYVRLAFAVAAHLEPEILIVDEVLAVGDAEFQRKCLGKMNSVSRDEGRTVIFVSHQMEAVQAICSRAIFLANGQMVMDDTPAAVITRYLGETMKFGETIRLADRTDRRGTGEFQYQEVFFTDETGRRVDAALPGKPLNIHLLIAKKSSSVSPGNILCSVGIHDEKGRRLFTLSNSLLLQNVRLEDKTELIWNIPDVQLYEGTYRCNIFLAQGTSSGVVDWIQDAFTLNVIPNDYFGTGQVVRNGQELFFVHHQLTVKNAAL